MHSTGFSLAKGCIWAIMFISCPWVYFLWIHQIPFWTCLHFRSPQCPYMVPGVICYLNILLIVLYIIWSVLWETVKKTFLVCFCHAGHTSTHLSQSKPSCELLHTSDPPSCLFPHLSAHSTSSLCSGIMMLCFPFDFQDCITIYLPICSGTKGCQHTGSTILGSVQT